MASLNWCNGLVWPGLSANGRNGFVWILVAGWLLDSTGSPVSFGCKAFNQLYIYYNDQNKKLHFALRHYVHACRDVAMYELCKKSISHRSEDTNSHPIKYCNLRLYAI